MYKKIILLCVLLCTSTHSALDTQRWLEIKPSYFFFSASPMRNIYNHGGLQIQGSTSIFICDYLDLYGSIGYRKAWGHALNSCKKTSLRVIPIDIGLKSVFKFCERFNYFFAIGPRYFHFYQHNDSPYVDCTIHNGGIGLFVNTGLNVALAHCFLLGIFGEYSYEKKKICPERSNVYSNGGVQISSFALGISLGYAF